jgi:hypothetical protein
MENFHDFIFRINEINWFSRCGTDEKEYNVVTSIFEAFDNYNLKMIDVWEPQICILENQAIEAITDENIDHIFETISSAIQNALWNGYCNFISRCQLENESGLENEILDCVKRDMSWAAIEVQLEQKGFFNDLLNIYEQGRWPCSYDGVYPHGKFVVM